MSEIKIQQSIENYQKALAQLEKAMECDLKQDSYRDSAILRFMLTYELAWKTLRKCLVDEKIEVSYPKEVLKQAYQAGWIENEETWLYMIDDRNLVTHTYNEERAEAITEDIVSFIVEFKKLAVFLNNKYSV